MEESNSKDFGMEWLWEIYFSS